jgi:epoxyqueuosine reductase
VLRAKHRGFLRNVAVALGNSGDPNAVAALAERLDDDEPLVRGHVAWALGRLGGDVAHAALQSRRAHEQDQTVAEEIAAALAELTRDPGHGGEEAAG